jgi:hemolysin III
MPYGKGGMVSAILEVVVDIAPEFVLQPVQNRPLFGRFRLPKEPFCGFSHMAGIALSVIGLIALLYAAKGRLTHVTAFGIYGFTLIALYTASTLYHSLHVSLEKEFVLMRLDHCAIFALIAGTYTPVCLVTLKGPVGYAMLAAVWGLAIFGSIGVFVWKLKFEVARVVLCVIMGWMALLAWEPLRAALPPAALWWLLTGGVVYSIGTIIFAADRPHLVPGKFSAHDLWHVFVLGGSFCHFMLIFLFVAR